MNVYQVNDCDWVAAKTFDEAKDWYLKETGVDEDDCWFEEESALDTPMWIELEELPDEELYDEQEVKDNMVRRTFKWVMEHIHNNQQTPYLIASTEY